MAQPQLNDGQFYYGVVKKTFNNPIGKYGGYIDRKKVYNVENPVKQEINQPKEHSREGQDKRDESQRTEATQPDGCS